MAIAQQTAPAAPKVSKEEKKLKRQREDREYRENEIRYGIRYKLILLFSVVILSLAIGITYVASDNQSRSLMNEKQKQGAIIMRGLNSAIKTRLIDIYAEKAAQIGNLQSKEDYLAFYRENSIAELIFEDIDQVKTQPDVIYAYIVGPHGIVLGHTNPDVAPYSIYNFEAGTASYFDSYRERKMAKVEHILNKINYSYKSADGQSRETEAIDFSSIMAFKTDAEIKDAVAEVHIGISLESVNQQIFDNQVSMQLVGLVAIVIAIVLAVIFATFLARPIRQIIAGMKAVSSGDFSANVLVRSRDEVGLLSRTFNIMLKGMSVLVSPEVAQVVLAGGDLLKGGQKREVTVLFSDIRGFTTISEALTPHEVVEMLNGYLEIMTDIIIKYGGVVDKFVGDEIFAVFGAPFDHPLHPLAACATALQMGRDLAEHNEKRQSEGLLPIHIGIGLNTGEVISGAMGSTKRVDYTSIGDTVNLGARLEGTNKVYGTLTIISEFTYEEVKNDVIARELDLIRVKGKHEPVKIFELLALNEKGEAIIERYLADRATRAKG